MVKWPSTHGPGLTTKYSYHQQTCAALLVLYWTLGQQMLVTDHNGCYDPATSQSDDLFHSFAQSNGDHAWWLSLFVHTFGQPQRISQTKPVRTLPITRLNVGTDDRPQVHDYVRGGPTRNDRVWWENHGKLFFWVDNSGTKKTHLFQAFAIKLFQALRRCWTVSSALRVSNSIKASLHWGSKSSHRWIGPHHHVRVTQFWSSMDPCQVKLGDQLAPENV